MIKITALGAGSAFIPRLAMDIFQIPGLEGGEFCLVDVDKKRLSLSFQATQKINEKLGGKWKILATTKRRETLKGSGYIINSIEVSGLNTVKYDYEIPLKYGVDQCIGDTIGPGGIMKALRTVPSWLGILKDAEELCPEAIVLNYTNPMSIMMLAGFKSSGMQMVGLCHSVQGSSRQLADYLDIPYEELKWKCAGINHLSWFVELKYKGEDMYPVLKKRVGEDKNLYEKDPVRFEIMFYFGYFVTESSGHFSEYVPYFRRSLKLVRKYCRESYLGESGFYARNWPKWREELDERRRKIIEGKEEIKPERSVEYASRVIESVEFNKSSVIYGSILNKGLIGNLPRNQVVETACLVDNNGTTPTHFGDLPPQLAALCRSNMAVYELTVEGILKRNYECLLQAFLLDPLTSATCSLEETKSMFDELLEAEKDYLPEKLFS